MRRERLDRVGRLAGPVLGVVRVHARGEGEFEARRFVGRGPPLAARAARVGARDVAAREDDARHARERRAAQLPRDVVVLAARLQIRADVHESADGRLFQRGRLGLGVARLLLGRRRRRRRLLGRGLLLRVLGRAAPRNLLVARFRAQRGHGGARRARGGPPRGREREREEASTRQGFCVSRSSLLVHGAEHRSKQAKPRGGARGSRCEQTIAPPRPRD
mmetsp:Transcript_3351/g.10162  ORF Transcript_3351/g.10162 Transcript_3351/m.10162 type:complete len:219 (+) Transcript_3351:678-1334(+)